MTRPCLTIHAGALGALTAITALTALTACGCSFLYRKVGGDFAGPPNAMWENLSPGARGLVERAFEGIDAGWLVDFHVHLVGTGSSSGIEIHPSWFGSWNPIVRGRTRVYMSAGGVTDPASADEAYLTRLLDLLRSLPQPHGMRCVLLALDRHYRPDGSVDPERTPLYVPNELVVRLAREHPGHFVPAVSVHPYRPDALAELERWALQGCRLVKWLPNAMGIDPSDPRCDEYYAAMRRHEMVLLTHTGRERAVDADELQHLGNPLLLRRPLDLGVKVVAFHCAADGEDADLDDPDRPCVPSFDLFLRLMDEPRYEGLLFGEISAISFFHRVGRPLETLLERTGLHHRLLNGSDYPLPGINFLTWTGRLARRGYVTSEEAAWLDEIYGYNPLLFDLVVKRTLRHPRTGMPFASTVFSVPGPLRHALGRAGGAGGSAG